MTSLRLTRFFNRVGILPNLELNRKNHKFALAKNLYLAYFVFLVLWLIVVLTYEGITGYLYPNSLTIDLISLLFLFIVGACAWLILRKGRLITSAYFLAIAVFGYSTVLVLYDPSRMAVASVGFLYSILLSGVVIGGTSSYLFSVGSIIISLVVWILSPPPQPLVTAPQTWLTISGLITGQMTLYIVLAITLHSLSEHDSASRKRLQRQADHMAILALTDPLTSIANRRQFLDQLQREFNRSKRYRRPLSLLYIDLDGFKEINDHYGHMFGDEILRGVARSMLSALRASDLLARIGGDEFAVLLPETDLQGALEVGNKLRKALAAFSRRTSLEETLPPLTFCAGVSQRHESDQSVDDMLARADGAQYLAKATGKAHTRVESEIP